MKMPLTVFASVKFAGEGGILPQRNDRLKLLLDSELMGASSMANKKRTE